MSLLPIRIDGASISRVGAEFSPTLPLKDWLTIGQQLNAIGSCYQFLLGDWLNFGQRTYGEKYRQACSDTGIDYGTLANYCYVCGKVEFSRRRETLTYSHHYEVSDLPMRDQDKWLEKADENHWSVAEMRREMGNRGGHQEGSATQSTWITEATKLTGYVNRALAEAEHWTKEQISLHRNALRDIVAFDAQLKAIEERL